MSKHQLQGATKGLQQEAAVSWGMDQCLRVLGSKEAGGEEERLKWLLMQAHHTGCDVMEGTMSVVIGRGLTRPSGGSGKMSFRLVQVEGGAAHQWFGGGGLSYRAPSPQSPRQKARQKVL